MIRIFCRAADAILKETQTLTSGMTNYPEVVLTFSQDWDGFGKAVVVRAGNVYKDVLVTNNKFVIPHECLATPGVNLSVGVSGDNGQGQTIPTIWCAVGEIYEGVDIDEGDNVGEATSELVGQMLAYAQACEDSAGEAVAAIIKNVEVDTTGANQYGTADVNITDEIVSGERTLTFIFTNLKGNGIESMVFTASGENKGRLTVTYSNGSTVTYDGIKEALAAIDDLIDAVTEAESDRADAETARALAEEQRAEQWEEWGDIAGDAEASALVSEGYALGKQNGIDVTPGSPYYENNAEYMKDAAAAYTLQADSFSGESAAWATGSYDGGVLPVPSSAPQYHNNAKYWADMAEQGAVAAGYLDLFIDENGHLIYQHSSNVNEDFYIDEDGHLIWEVG